MDERVTTPTGATGTNGLPTDADLIRLLRARVQRLEGAIGAYLDSQTEIGTRVGAAWQRYDGALDRNDPKWRDEAQRFIGMYRVSLPKRAAAVKALLAAVTQDFREAVLTDEAMTDEQRAYWVALYDAEDAAKEQGE